MTQRQWLAVGVLGSGLLGVGVMALFATGRPKDAYAIAGAAALTSVILAAGRVLSGDEAPAGGLHAADVAGTPGL